jgi:hypothetical protein
MILAVDWLTVSSLATAGATLVLAFATFGSVRSANRAARAAERSLLAGLRPVLMPSRVDDVPQKVGFVDDRWFMIPGAGAVAEVGEDTIYLAASVRNMGAGIAVLHGWCLHLDPRVGSIEAAPLEDFHRLTRDLYIAPSEAGFWQGALRDPRASAAGRPDPLRRPRGRPADDQHVRVHPARGRDVDGVGLAPLEHRPTGAALRELSSVSTLAHPVVLSPGPARPGPARPRPARFG